MIKLAPLLGLAALPACVAYNVEDGDGTARARIGQAVTIGTFDATPFEVIEDSRCPTGVQCIWEGQLRLRVRIDFADSVTTRELTLGQAQAVGAGSLTLAEAEPHPAEGRTIYPEEYRFAFTYVPGGGQ